MREGVLIKIGGGELDKVLKLYFKGWVEGVKGI